MDKNNLNRYNSVILSKSLKNVDTISNTTSSLMPQKGGYLDATSSFMPQKGGYLNNNKNKDINQLMSMLSATSESNYTTNSTNTKEIKNKLLNILQDGGGRREEYKELIDTFKLFNEYVILYNVKSLEYWKIIKHNEFEDKIISILNNLPIRDKKAFLENEIRMFLLTNQKILMNHPILLLIYNNIMSKIIDKSDIELNEIIQQITKELYEQISKIIINYLTNPPKQIDDDKRQDAFQTESVFLFYLYDMLTRTRNNIEEVLISYIENSISKPAGFIVPPQPPALPAPQLPSQISELKKEIDRLEQWERNKLAQSAAASAASASVASAASASVAPTRYQQRR